MAATAQPAPGTEYGPCADESCGHIDCAEARQIATTPCSECAEPIGYEKRFFQRENWTVLTHMLCAIKRRDKEAAPKLCAGCAVREPFAHRCLGEGCPCVECRDADRLFP